MKMKIILILMLTLMYVKDVFSSEYIMKLSNKHYKGSIKGSATCDLFSNECLIDRSYVPALFGNN
jgi:hypothetical protein